MLDRYLAEFFVGYLRRNNLVPRSCLCIGRPNLALTDWEISRLVKRHRLAPAPGLLRGDYLRFADPLFRAVGIEKVTFLDVDAREGEPQVVHDMNLPIPEALHGKFDLVIDDGTLEHVYNVATAMANCMNALTVGGVMMAWNPVNNMPGHGFYQFSPDLFYRTFSKENGFTDQRVLIWRHQFRMNFQVMPDPLVSGDARDFMSKRKVNMFSTAKKVSQVTPFASGFPIQSGYQIIMSRPDRPFSSQRAKQVLGIISRFGRMGIPTMLLRLMESVQVSVYNPKNRP